MALLNFIISAIGFGLLVVIIGVVFFFLYNAYGGLIKSLFFKFKWYRKKQYNLWVDVVINCLANDYTEEDIIKLMGTNGMNEEDIYKIFDLVNDKFKKLKGGVK